MLVGDPLEFLALHHLGLGDDQFSDQVDEAVEFERIDTHYASRRRHGRLGGYHLGRHGRQRSLRLRRR